MVAYGIRTRDTAFERAMLTFIIAIYKVEILFNLLFMNFWHKFGTFIAKKL